MLVDCIFSLPSYELTTLANVTDTSVVPDVLSSANTVLSLQECNILGDRSYDARDVYNLVKEIYNVDTVTPLN